MYRRRAKTAGAMSSPFSVCRGCSEAARLDCGPEAPASSTTFKKSYKKSKRHREGRQAQAEPPATPACGRFSLRRGATAGSALRHGNGDEIGRASCRERV